MQIVLRDFGSQFVLFDGRYLKPRFGEGQCVPADAATKIRDQFDAASRKPLGMPSGNLLPSCLLEALFRE